MKKRLPKKAVNTAPEFLVNAAELLHQRGHDYDQPEGERSAAKTAHAFNAITGKDINESEVWLLLTLLKLVRQNHAPEFHRDSAEDAVAYAALLAESQVKGA
jgi:hypothetical protein